MPILYINTGTNPNAGDGDSIRLAFTKINANFGELYGNLQTSIPLPAGNTGKFLSSDGTDIVWSDLPEFTTNELVNGSYSLVLDSSGNVNLATGTNIYIGGTPISLDIAVSDTAPSDPTTGSLWYDEISGRMYVWYDTNWVDASPRGPAGTQLPNENGHAGEFLTTDGSNLSWAAVSSVVGAQGPQGPSGAAGSNGAQGPQGPQGVVGPTGPSRTDQDLFTTSTVTFSNLTVTNTASFIDVEVSGLLTLGQYQGYNDLSIIKDDPEILNFTLRNLHPDSSTEINIVDNYSGGLTIVHQNSTADSGDFAAGENFIYGESINDTINIGRNQDLKFFADENWTNWSSATPVLVMRKSDGSVIVNKDIYSGDIIPQSDNTYNLGASTSTWNNLWVNYITGSGDVVINATTGTNTSTWTFGTGGQLTVPGSIIPDGDNLYDLGSTSSQWRSLYVSTTTIYIGGIPLTMDTTTSLTVDGNPVVTYISTSGNFSAGGVTVQRAVGPQGPTGPSGENGYVGSDGPQGVTGPQGPQGVIGNTGPQGVAGAQGPQGDTGPQGPQGVVGAQGPQGDTGPQGPQGVAGPQGPQGPGANQTLNTSSNVTFVNVTANKFVGDGSSLTNVTMSQITSIVGTGTNVNLVAGSYTYTFDNAGTFTMPVNGDIVMTGTNSILSVSGTSLLGGYTQVGGYYSTLGVKYPGGGVQHGMTLQPTTDNTNAINFLNAAGTSIGSITQTTSTVVFTGDGSGLTNLPGVTTKTTGQWTVATGTGTYSITVPASGTYQIWVRGNIPNGIISYNATAVVTNTNVPVVGTQYAWVYSGGGTPIDFTSIPNQFTGTNSTIVRSSTAPSATTNRFDFGINNTSTSSQIVYWGYVTL